MPREHPMQPQTHEARGKGPKTGAQHRDCRVYRYEDEQPETWYVVPMAGSLGATLLAKDASGRWPTFPTYEAAIAAIDAVVPDLPSAFK